MRLRDYDPKVLFGLGALSVLGLLALSSAPAPLLQIPGPAPGPQPNAPLPGGPLPSGTTALTGYLSTAFFQALNNLAAYFRSKGANINAEDLAAVFLAESGVKPSQPNSIRCAGLNQICKLSNVGWGGTVEQYLALPGEEQLKYVQRYFDNVNKYPQIRDYGSLYLANFSPAFMGKPDNFVMYPASHASYALNRGVDFGGKGYIEVADMAKFVRAATLANPAKWAELRMRIASAATPSGNV